MPYSIPTTPEHLLVLARDIRKEDERELADGAGHTPLEALEIGFVHSTKCLSIFTDDDELVFICGIVPSTIDPLIAHPWLIATDRLDDMKKTFLKHSKEYLADLGEGFPLLMNCCDKRNTTHIRWLKWLGFSFIKEHPEAGVGKVPFLEFVKIGDTNV